MKDFSTIKFNGKFRDYQQRVINGADKYFKDGKINIVAAPGSGKTILGLELIRHLNAPCLIFSPTTTIKQQWADRFKDMFLNKEQNIDDFVSFDLHECSLLTSITYQALHSAMKKEIVKTEDEIVDNSDVDIFKIITNNNIKTICLDESHHLQNEWQKSLEKFIKLLDKNIKIVALTATPPYDSTEQEWKRYIDICGEIDEEIYVTELVKAKNLCPHQDYVYFNYPTPKESESIIEHKERAYLAVEEILKLESLKDLNEILNLNYEDNIDEILTYLGEYASIISLLKYAKYEINEELFNFIDSKTKIKPFSLTEAEIAIQFIINAKDINIDFRNQIIHILKKYKLLSLNVVNLNSTESIDKKIISSVGKLESIKCIAQSEIVTFGEKLKMLVLTDFIRKEAISSIGTNEEFEEVSIVSIFETIRRNTKTDIGVVSGSLVILQDKLISYFKTNKIPCSLKKLENTEYSIYSLKGSNKDKVKIISELFEKGYIKILVGTKSLLGEGWDSPCINSLILASFVGSFMLSNQMRGRAIRIDKNDPEKFSNIWHLVTLEPGSIKHYFDDKDDQINSHDFDTLKRRFECFVGPNYYTNTIESGIERLTIIKPPYTRENIEAINKKMLNLSSQKDILNYTWNNALKSTELNIENEIPDNRKINPLSFKDYFLSTILTTLEIAISIILILSFVKSSLKSFRLLTFFIFLVLTVLTITLISASTKQLLQHISPKKSIQTFSECILSTFKKIKIIKSKPKLFYNENKKEKTISVILKNAPLREQNAFNKAITELYSPIEEPKYLIIKKKKEKYNFFYSFACPSAFGKNKNYAEIFKAELEKKSSEYGLISTSTEYGKDMLLKCKRYSYITKNSRKIESKQTNK